MQLGKFFNSMQIGTSKSIEAKFYESEIVVKITCLQLEHEQLLIASNAIIGDDSLIALQTKMEH